jgi:hypothetical protein
MTSYVVLGALIKVAAIHLSHISAILSANFMSSASLHTVVIFIALSAGDISAISAMNVNDCCVHWPIAYHDHLSTSLIFQNTAFAWRYNSS